MAANGNWPPDPDDHWMAAGCSMRCPLSKMRDANRYTRHTTHVQADEQAASQERSAAIFGNRYFAEVVLAVDRLSAAGDAFVTTRMVASDTTLGDSLVRPVMHRLGAAGLIAALPRTGGRRSTLNYQVIRGLLWATLVAVCAETTPADAAQASGA